VGHPGLHPIGTRGETEQQHPLLGYDEPCERRTFPDVLLRGPAQSFLYLLIAKPPTSLIHLNCSWGDDAPLQPVALTMRTFVFFCAFTILGGGNVFAETASPNPNQMHITISPSPYSVGGVFLGEKVPFGGAARLGYKCADSKKFEGFSWCIKGGSEGEARGQFKVWYSLMLGKDGTVVYVNRYQEPAYWKANEAKDDIERYSKKVGQEPRIVHLPPHPGFPKGTLATWGDVLLEPIVGEELRLLAADKPLPQGIAIDFIGDFTKSARQGLPIYRLAGGAGFVWAGSFNDAGRGTLRFAAVNASAYMLQPAQTSSQCRVSDPTSTPLNVRTSPNGRILGTLENGLVVKILDETTDRNGSSWSYVARADDEMPIGWVYGSYLDCRTNAVSNDPPKGGNSRPPEQKNEEVDGTGFFVTPTHILTNFHVVDGCRVVTLSVPGAPYYAGRVVAFDSTNDLALIRLNETADNLRPSVIPALRSRVRLGESAFVFGYPLSGLLSSAGNFTSGSISSLSGLGDDIGKVQISAPVQPGNSGGPLLDIYGNVVGVVVAKLNAGRLSQLIDDIPQNVNFAIKASVAISFLEANNVGIAPFSEGGAPLQPTDVAERARQFSVQVTCRRQN
jgi:S1-C subfamily serine protease